MRTARRCLSPFSAGLSASSVSVGEARALSGRAARHEASPRTGGHSAGQRKPASWSSASSTAAPQWRGAQQCPVRIVSPRRLSGRARERPPLQLRFAGHRQPRKSLPTLRITGGPQKSVSQTRPMSPLRMVCGRHRCRTMVSSSRATRAPAAAAHGQPLLTVEPLDPFPVHPMTLAPRHHVQSAIAEPTPIPGEGLQPPGLRNVEPAEPGLPFVTGRRADPVPPAHLHRRHTGLLLAQDPDDLFRSGVYASPQSVNLDRFILSVLRWADPCNSWRRFRGSRHHGNCVRSHRQ
jgi:hypothetical protein